MQTRIVQIELPNGRPIARWEIEYRATQEAPWRRDLGGCFASTAEAEFAAEARYRRSVRGTSRH